MKNKTPVDKSGETRTWNEDFRPSTEAEPIWKPATGPNGAVYYIMELVNGRLVVSNTGSIAFWPRPI